MAQTTNDQQRMEGAVTSVAEKWERFSDGLTSDERTVLGLALREVQAGPNPTTDDVAGHDYFIERAAKAYVDALPIWDQLKAAVAQMTRPINWNP